MNSLLTIYNLNFSEKIIQEILMGNGYTCRKQNFQKAVGSDSPVTLAYVSVHFFHRFSAHIHGITFKANR